MNRSESGRYIECPLDTKARQHIMSLIRACLNDHPPSGTVVEEEEWFDIELVIAEVLANIERHAFGERQDGWIRFLPCIEQDEKGVYLDLEFVDEGEAPDPEHFASRSPDDFRRGGLGLSLMAQIMDRVEHRVLKAENRLLLRKYLGFIRHVPREIFHLLRIESVGTYFFFLYGSFTEDRVWNFDIDGIQGSRVFVNLRGLSDIDEVGIQALISLQARLAQRNTAISIRQIPDKIRRILVSTGHIKNIMGRARESERETAEILLVDQNEETISRIRSAMADESVNVVTAANAVEIQAKMQFNPPDLVILSLDLDEEEAEALLWAFRSEPSWSSVPLILSAIESTRNPSGILSGDIEDFLPLPMEAGELRLRINRVLERSHRMTGALPLLRALGNQIEPEALDNISDQIEKLQELGELFVDTNGVGAEFRGWMVWGQLSYGSIVRAKKYGEGNWVVVIGRGEKPGLSSLHMAGYSAALIPLILEAIPPSVEEFRAEMGKYLAELTIDVDPYYFTFMRYSDGELTIWGGEGAETGWIRGAKGAVALPGFTVGATGKEPRCIDERSDGSWRLISPAFRMTGDEVWSEDLAKLRHSREGIVRTDFWAFDFAPGEEGGNFKI